jgi:hypothetical protein
MNIQLSITCSGDADFAALARMLNAVAGTGLPYTVQAPPAMPVPPSTAPAPAPVIAPPMPRVEAVPAPPLSPEAKAGLAKLEATVAAPAPADADRPAEVKAQVAEIRAEQKEKRKGRQKRVPPVPKPEGGYGPQAPSDPEVKKEWDARRIVVRDQVSLALNALHLKGMDSKFGEKWLTELMRFYGDGKLSTVPDGNLDALVAEALAGPEDCRLSEKDLDDARKELAQQAETAEAGAA